MRMNKITSIFRIFLCVLFLVLGNCELASGQGRTYLRMTCKVNEQFLVITNDGNVRTSGINNSNLANNCSDHTIWGSFQSGDGRLIFQKINGREIYLKASGGTISLTTEQAEATVFSCSDWSLISYTSNNQQYSLRYNNNTLFGEIGTGWTNTIDVQMGQVGLNWTDVSGFDNITIENFPLTQPQARQFVVMKSDGSSFLTHVGNTVVESESFSPDACIWESNSNLNNGNAIGNTERQALTFKNGNTTYTLGDRATTQTTADYRVYSVTETRLAAGTNNLRVSITAANNNGINEGESKVMSVTPSGSITLAAIDYEFAGSHHYMSNGAYLGNSRVLNYNSDFIEARWSMSGGEMSSALTGTSKNGATLEYREDADVQQSVQVRLSLHSNFFPDVNDISTTYDVTLKTRNLVSSGLYVIRINGTYLKNNNGQIGTSTTFDPETCLWNAQGSTGNLRFSNSGKNLLYSSNAIQLSDNTYTTWTVSDIEAGTVKYGNSSLALNGNTWNLSSGTAAGCAYKVTVTEHEPQMTEPQIQGSGTISSTGNQQYSYSNASYIPAWTDYQFDNGTHHTFCTQTGLTNGTGAPNSVSFAYSWSLSANASGNMSVNNSGVVNYHTAFAENAQVTLTLTATSTPKTFTVHKTIEVQAALGDMYCYIRNASRMHGQNHYDNFDYYLAVSSQQTGGRNMLEVQANPDFDELFLLRKYNNDYFQIIHVSDQKYVLAVSGISNNSQNCIVLGNQSTDINNINSSLFTIGKIGNSDRYFIRPYAVSGNYSFNPNNYGQMPIQMYQYNENEADSPSLWYFDRQEYTPLEDGVWNIQNRTDNDRYLMTENNGTRAITASADNLPNESYWTVRRSGSVYYQFISMDGRYLTSGNMQLNSTDYAENATVMTANPDNMDKTLFRVDKVGDYYTMVPKMAGSNMSLTSYDNANTGTGWRFWIYEQRANWKFIEPKGASAGSYVIENGGKYLANVSGTVTAVSDFNPATCIWTAVGNGGNLSFANGGKYLQNSNGSVALSNSPVTWMVNKSVSGSIKSGNNFLHVSNGNWVVDGTSSECAFIITASNTTAIETKPTITTGPSSISYLGNFQYNYTPASFVNANSYTWNGQEHFVSPDGQTYYGTTAPESESFTYVWSISDHAIGYMTVTDAGLLKYDNAFDSPTNVTLTLTATSVSKEYTATKTINISVAGYCAPGGNYVLYSSERFLCNDNGTLRATSSFNPYNCIWKAVAVEQNGRNCLYFTNNNRRLEFNGNQYWIVNSNSEGYLQALNNENSFLSYNTQNKTWAVGSEPDGCAFAVTDTIHHGNVNSNPQISTRETVFSELRSYKFFISVPAEIIDAYDEYVLLDGPHLYVRNGAFIGTTQPETEQFLYSWSIDDETGHTSIDQSGNLTYNETFSSPTNVTVTLTAKRSKDNSKRTAAQRVLMNVAESGYANAQYEDLYCYIINYSNDPNNQTYYLYPSDNLYATGQRYLKTFNATTDQQKQNAVWILRKYSNDSYQIIHAQTGQYVIANAIERTGHAVHLEPNTNNLARSLFEIGEIVIEQYGYYIKPKASAVNEEFGISFNPAGNNGNDIQLYGIKDNDHKKVPGSMWLIQEAKAATPIIMAEDGKVSISTTTSGAYICYTTDGSTPTARSPRYTGEFEFQDGNIIKAIAFAEGYLESNIAVQEIHMISSLDDIPDNGADGYYVLTCDIEAPADYESKKNFIGVFDGGYHTISGLTAPLFYNTVDAVVKNVRLDNIDITGTGNLGAITCLAKGRTVIINCGILASDASTISGGSNVGSIAGQIENKARVVNCYSFATVQGTTVGGIVGSNSGTASTIEDIHTMVMNCIFYGDLDGTNISPVYGGTVIENRNNINTYTFYQAFDTNGDIKYNATDVDNSMPVTDNSYLDRFEFYRSMLNSHRELAAFYAFDDHTRMDQVGKWILDTDIAPYPIVSTWRSFTKKTLERVIPNTTNDMQGRQLRTIPVTFIIQGQNKTINRTYDLPVTDMDTARWDFTANKIVLPFANEIYTDDASWRPRVPNDADEYKSMIITGWECTSISGGTAGSKLTDYDGDGIGRDYNFSDPDCTAKDIFDISGANVRDPEGSRDGNFNPFVYAQGGNFVVPTDATAITFTAHWATCVYLSDAGEDVAYNPEFTESTQIGSYSWENRTETIISSSFRDVSYRDGWTVTTNPSTTNWPDGLGERWDNISDFLEFYRYDQGHSFSITQVVEDMAPGTYMLRFYGFSRHGDYAYNHQEKNAQNMFGSHVYIYAKQGNNELNRDTLKSVYDHTAQEVNAVMEGFDAFNSNAENNLDGYVHSLGAAKIAFSHGYYLNELMFEVPEEGNVEIGIVSDFMPSHSWATFRDMKLYKLIDETFTDMYNQEKKIVHTMTDALSKISENEIPNNQAIVLVGNYHLNDRIIGNSFAQGNGALDLNKAITFMSTDDDCDQEPDYCMYMYTSNPSGISRTDTPPLRFDFLTCPGIGMAARVSGSSAVPGIGIWHTRGWYETTETYLGIHSEAEINPSFKRNQWMSPWIINGGVYERIITNFDGERNLNTNNNAYIRLGGKALIRQFHPGNHDDKNYTTYLIPVNVNGGEIEECFMTGREGSTSSPRTNGNVRFWSNGGYIHEFLGAYMAPVNGNVTAKIDRTIFDYFYGGGMNANQPVHGNIDVEINNSWAGYYVGGPKVGDMNENTSVTTKADGSIFGNFFGGGYGGTSTARKTVYNETVGVEVSISDDLPYPVGFANYTGRRLRFEEGYGIATGYGFEYFFEAGGQGNLISRFFVDYSSLSLATVRSVSNTLNNCTVLNDFYGGGRQGYVNGSVTSSLTDCTIQGSAFAGGYTGRYKETPVATGTKPEYSTYLFHMGVFTPFGKTENETYHWEQVQTLESYYNANTKSLFTDTDMTLMGKVNGTTSLTIDGASKIEGNVFGGGNQADVNGATNVFIISDDTEITGTVFGGGNESNVTNEDSATGNTTVTITGGSIGGDVFGGGNQGNVSGDPHVTIGQQ